MASESRPNDTTLVVTRELAAPRALVFDAWTKAEHLVQWYPPDGFRLECDLDFRPGGALRLRMIGHGMDHTVRGVYREIVRPERIVLAMQFDDVPDLELAQTITFVERDGVTTLTLRMELPPWDTIPAAHQSIMRFRWDGADRGASQTLAHLDAFVRR
jgi:uncharacterized protein YndB with AHSA1/START domain